MGYLFSQTLFWIILAFLLGLLFGWLLKSIFCRSSHDDNTASYAATGAAAGSSVATTDVDADAGVAVDADGDGDVDYYVTDDMKPATLTSPIGGVADDLKRIKGVGPVIENTLNDLGIFNFSQVADFSADNVKWVDNHISFPGRIDREEWVRQAKDLAAGRKTEFASRYDKGEVGEDNPNA